MMKKLLIVVGTRPNFIKVTQFHKVIQDFPDLEMKLVHTGQHYDEQMSKSFFKLLDIPAPDYLLDCSRENPTQQIGCMIQQLDKVVTDYRPDLMIVVGDVNSTLAGAIVANKNNIELAHLESGLRSFDKSMPEEHNRVLTDAITNLFFITEDSGLKHLKAEGKSQESLHLVGNTMIDTLVAFRDKIDSNPILENYKLQKGDYVLMTMHRPATVDSKENLEKLVELITSISQQHQIVFPIHPRTLNNLQKFGLEEQILANKQVIQCPPLDYLSLQKLISGAKYLLTDSGGLQEESTFHQVPCITLRPNTERPITCSLGSNTLIETLDINQIKAIIETIENGSYKRGEIPPLWDGKASRRILQVIQNHLNPKEEAVMSEPTSTLR